MASQVFIVVGGTLALLGVISGAIGGSTLYSGKARREYVQRVANFPKGNSKAQRREEAAPYRKELVKKEKGKDKFTVAGWGLAIVGSACALIGAVID